MKTIFLSAALAMIPAAAFATSLHPDTFNYTTFTGRVKTEVIFCVTSPCPPRVYLEDKAGNQVTIVGDLLGDVEAFDGQVVTVQGPRFDASIDFTSGVNVRDFAPGTGKHFITGEVVDLSANCPPNALCAPELAIKRTDGTMTRLADDPAMNEKLLGLVGATVSVRGKFEQESACEMCPGFKSVYRVHPEANIFVKGTLQTAYHTMDLPLPGEERASHYLEFPNGSYFPIYGDYRGELVDSTVWATAGWDKDFRDRDILRMKRASRPVFDHGGSPWMPAPIDPIPWEPHPWMPTPIDPPWEYHPWPVGEGTNVSRGADTTGAATGSTVDGSAGSTGGGQSR